MKIAMRSLWAGIFILGMSSFNSNAWVKVGQVFCDANTNSTIDAGDVPVSGVLVVVLNTSGTFSNAAWTSANGSFSISLQEKPDTYVDFVAAATLSAGVTVLPAMGSFSTTADAQNVTNSFLLVGGVCQESGACWLTGGGTIRSGRGKPDFSFGGNVYPGCDPRAGDGGNWNVVAHSLKLHFQGTSIQVVDCGNVPGIPPGSRSPKTPFNFIEFQGTGSIKGIAGNRAKRQSVSFFARAEDRGEPGHRVDRLYLRVESSDGTTVLLISGTASDPTVVDPVPIATGNLQIHVSSCDTPPF